MNIFVSWSGELSHRYAKLIDWWLPLVLTSVRTYVSSNQLESGTRWNVELSKELASDSYGILCLTAASRLAPWVNFEAGALSKVAESSRVVPLLFGIRKADVDYPLAQFHMRVAEQDDMFALVTDINSTSESPLDASRLNEILAVWWPKFEAKLEEIFRETPSEMVAGAEPSDSAKILEEILDTVRAQQRQLSTPEQILPPEYLRELLSPQRAKSLTAATTSLIISLSKLVDAIGADPADRVSKRAVLTELLDLLKPFTAIVNYSTDARQMQSIRRLNARVEDMFNKLVPIINPPAEDNFEDEIPF